MAARPSRIVRRTIPALSANPILVTTCQPLDLYLALHTVDCDIEYTWIDPTVTPANAKTVFDAPSGPFAFHVFQLNVLGLIPQGSTNTLELFRMAFGGGPNSGFAGPWGLWMRNSVDQAVADGLIGLICEGDHRMFED